MTHLRLISSAQEHGKGGRNIATDSVRWDQDGLCNGGASTREFHAEAKPTNPRPMTIPECVLTLALLVVAAVLLISNAT